MLRTLTRTLVLVLLSAATAHAQTTMLFGRGNNGNVNDAIVRGNSGSWVPPWTSCVSTIAGVSARRFLSGGLYFNDYALMCWDVTALPGGAAASSATVTLQSNGQGTYAGTIAGDWYNFGAACDTADYPAGGAVLDGSSVASGTAVSLFTTANVDVTLNLLNPGTHVVGSTVCIRIGGEQAGAPVGLDNGAIFYSHAQSAAREALLTVVFTVGTATPTSAPTNTPTATKTSTPLTTPTPLPTGTCLPGIVTPCVQGPLCLEPGP